MMPESMKAEGKKAIVSFLALLGCVAAFAAACWAFASIAHAVDAPTVQAHGASDASPDQGVCHDEIVHLLPEVALHGGALSLRIACAHPDAQLSMSVLDGRTAICRCPAHVPAPAPSASSREARLLHAEHRLDQIEFERSVHSTLDEGHLGRIQALEREIIDLKKAHR